MSDLIEINRKDLILSYKSKSLIVKAFPVTLNIESTNLCNLDCIMCPRRLMKRNVGMMDFSLFKKIIDESKDFVEIIRLHLFGEPLLHNRIVDMINYAEKSGIRTVISTNATVLNKDISQKILESELSFLVLSLDAAKKDTYEKIRTSLDFEKVKTNIETFLKIMNEKKSIKPVVAIQLIKMPYNKEEEELFIKQWLGGENVHIFIKEFTNWAGQVEEINQLGSSSPIPDQQVVSPCFNLWSSLSIYWDGTVVPCCYDYDGSYILGNVRDQSIISIWNNEKMKQIRKTHTTSSQNNIKLCSKCGIWGCKIIPEDTLSPFYQKNVVMKTFSTNITGKNINSKNEKLILNTDDFSLGEGWYEIENWPPIIRWTAKEADIYCTVKTTSKLYINMLSYYPDITKVHLYINDILFKEVLLKKSEWSLFCLEIPESEVGKKLKISIRLDNFWTPKDVFNNQDDRKLGIAISEMWIE